jgi:hypothetical protein
MQYEGVLEYWSTGVLGLRAEMGLIFTILPLAIRDPNMVYIFPLYQPFINPLLHHSNLSRRSAAKMDTPLLQVLLTSSFDKEWITAVYQQLRSTAPKLSAALPETVCQGI